MKKVIKVVVIISSIILVILLSYVVKIVIDNNSNTPMIFTSENWNKHIWQRERMLESLNSQFKLTSMTYDEIEQLLGTNGVVEGSNKNKLGYYIGKDKIIPHYLWFGFDENGTVKSILTNGRTTSTKLFKSA